ncbi:GIY-YIG nuclease family protein [Arthrobacter celericrescens]|uniref:GIY-YIG nuclease family protein n=1 Tax=Arthrobacter celericrescens TaxID=2320851 RepID=UPI0013C459F8|nr:hypothetical protein [Arthrobacter celericrescens]
MSEFEDSLLVAVVQSLSGNRYSISAATTAIPNNPGLYAVHGGEDVWAALGLERRPTDVPLYVGKAEDSLITRDLKTHFAVDPDHAPRTGSSTLRRSLAALLHDRLGLRGVPRNKADPGYFHNFGLEQDADRRLTDWMQRHLTLACWPKPPDLRLKLRDIERLVLEHWDPPINLRDSPTKLPQLVAARAFMANQARAWAVEHGGEDFSNDS